MKNNDGLRIEVAPTATEEVRSLIGELETILSAEYPPEQRHGLALDAIFQPHIRFFLARLRGAAVGCGGVAIFSDFAEVKRMYVRDVARRQGVADAILARIEEEVRGAGLSLLRLARLSQLGQAGGEFWGWEGAKSESVQRCGFEIRL